MLAGCGRGVALCQDQREGAHRADHRAHDLCAAHLYIAFSCREKAPDRLTAEATETDSDAIFGDDNVELFLDTNCDRATYFHFAINSAGAHYQAFCDLRDGDSIRKEDWDPGWQVTTSIGSRSWTAEMSIPFASLGVTRPAPAAVWGINFCRSWRRDPPGEFSTWSGAVGFNRPEQFGLAVFGVGVDTTAFAQALRKAGDSARGGPGGARKIDLHMDRFFYTPDIARMHIQVSRKTQGGSDLEIEIRKDQSTGPVAYRNIPLAAGTDEYELSLDMVDCGRSAGTWFRRVCAMRRAKLRTRPIASSSREEWRLPPRRRRP